MSQRLEAWRAENVLEILVHQASIGNGSLALQGLQLLLFGTIIGGRNLILEQLIDKRIDTADEETGDGRDMADVLARGITIFHGRNVGLSYLAVIFNGEDQRNVNIDSLGQGLLNGRNTPRRPRYLDHQVRAVHHFPETPHFRECAFGIVCQIGGNFQAHKTILLARCLVDRAQPVRHSLNILYDERFVDITRTLARPDQIRYLLIISVTLTDRLLKDGRISRNTTHPIFIQQASELTRNKLAPVNIIVPDTLFQSLQFQ